MPWGDCTGPWWTGNCNSGSRRSHGRSASCRRRFGRSFGEPSRLPTTKDEISYLEAVARDLESKLKNVRDRIEGLQSMLGSIENEYRRE